MPEITTILSAIDQGDPHASEQLLPLVYDELRKLAAQKLAQEKPGQTLEATALVRTGHRAADQPQVRLVHQRGGLKRLAGLFLRQFLRRQLAQLVVDDGQKLLGGVRVAVLDGVENLGHVTHGTAFRLENPNLWKHPTIVVWRRHLGWRIDN